MPVLEGFEIVRLFHSVIVVCVSVVRPQQGHKLEIEFTEDILAPYWNRRAT